MPDPHPSGVDRRQDRGQNAAQHNEEPACAERPHPERLSPKDKRPQPNHGKDRTDQQSKLPEFFACRRVSHGPFPPFASRARILSSNPNPPPGVSAPLSSAHNSR